jgi:hypothetical protein
VDVTTGEEAAVGIDFRATPMPASDPLHQQRRTTLTAMRWGLIAVCAALIIFSDRMAGRLGFAVLLLLAIILGRYGSRRFAGLPRTERPEPIGQPHAPDPDVRRREAK